MLPQLANDELICECVRETGTKALIAIIVRVPSAVYDDVFSYAVHFTDPWCALYWEHKPLVLLSSEAAHAAIRETWHLTNSARRSLRRNRARAYESR